MNKKNKNIDLENPFPPLGDRGLFGARLTVVGAGPGDVDLITLKAILWVSAKAVMHFSKNKSTNLL